MSKKLQISYEKLTATPLDNSILVCGEISSRWNLLEQFKVDEIIEHYPYLTELKEELAKERIEE